MRFAFRRYFVITMGGLAMIMFVIRFVLFTIYESPKVSLIPRAALKILISPCANLVSDGKGAR